MSFKIRWGYLPRVAKEWAITLLVTAVFWIAAFVTVFFNPQVAFLLAVVSLVAVLRNRQIWKSNRFSEDIAEAVKRYELEYPQNAR